MLGHLLRSALIKINVLKTESQSARGLCKRIVDKPVILQDVLGQNRNRV